MGRFRHTHRQWGPRYAAENIKTEKNHMLSVRAPQGVSIKACVRGAERVLIDKETAVDVLACVIS